jgi:hypothetical protein
MNQIQKIKFLIIYRLLKVLVVVGHHNVECCYLMPGVNERANGVLADEYYQNLIKENSEKLHRRRSKIIKYL